MSKRVLMRVTCGIYEAISSIQLSFADGIESPTFGCSIGDQLKCPLEIPDDEVITCIRVQHSEENAQIQNITFETDEGTEIEFNGKKSDGRWSEFELAEGELIVGCYGSCRSDAESEIVSLGFVLWTPLH